MIVSTCLSIAVVSQGVFAGSSSVPPLRTEKGLKLTRYAANGHEALLAPRDTQYLAQDTTFHIFATIPVGTKQSRQYEVLIDTGSSDLVLLKRSGIKTSDSNLKSYKNESCAATYGTGHQTVKGSIYKGNYTVGGGSTSGYFCLADPVGPYGHAQPAAAPYLKDGVLGLGFPSNVSGVSYKTGSSPITAAGWNGFSLYIPSKDQKGTGELIPNGVDPAYFASPDLWQSQTILYGQGSGADPRYHGYWQFEYTNWSINNGYAGTPPTQIGYIDSGSPFIRLDSNATKAIYNALGLKVGSPNIACAKKQTGPELLFDFGYYAGVKHVYPIPASSYILERANGSCRVAIEQLADDTRPTVFGWPFLQSFYTYFDITDRIISFNFNVG